MTKFCRTADEEGVKCLGHLKQYSLGLEYPLSQEPLNLKGETMNISDIMPKKRCYMIKKPFDCEHCPVYKPDDYPCDRHIENKTIDDCTLALQTAIDEGKLIPAVPKDEKGNYLCEHVKDDELRPDCIWCRFTLADKFHDKIKNGELIPAERLSKEKLGDIITESALAKLCGDSLIKGSGGMFGIQVWGTAIDKLAQAILNHIKGEKK